MKPRPRSGPRPEPSGFWQSLGRLIRPSITRKLAFSYLIIAGTSLVSITYALVGLHSQMNDITGLVTGDFRAYSAARNLRTNLLAQETLAQQYAVLESAELLSLLRGREREFDELWAAFAALPRLESKSGRFDQAAAEYRTLRDQLNGASTEGGAGADSDAMQARLSAVRTEMLRGIDAYRNHQRLTIDTTLHGLSTQSENTYRWALFLLIFGLLVGAPVALSVALSIHRSVAKLTSATLAIGEGRFDLDLDDRGGDEFGELAYQFVRMGRKLRDLEQIQLDANPLTHLPGNLAIERELQRRIDAEEPFAHAYIDLDNFKAYNDRYGYDRGNQIIAWVGDVIRDAVHDDGNESDLVGHVGGDDYVLLTTPDRADAIAQRVIDTFDAEIRGFYSAEDLAAGTFVGLDRAGFERSFSLMTITIAVVSSGNFVNPSPRAISHQCAQMKEHLKRKPGSNYLLDRRSRH